MKIILLTLILTMATVIVHHECIMSIKNGLLNTVRQPQRWIVGATVILLLLAHIVEISLFAVGYLMIENYLHDGQIIGENSHELITVLYFSFTSYTTLGIGDLRPTGAIRLLAGFEGLLGLLMIGWSASFLYLEMRSFWTYER